MRRRPWATVVAVGHSIATYIRLGLAGPGRGTGGAGLGLEELDHTILNIMHSKPHWTHNKTLIEHKIILPHAHDHAAQFFMHH